MLFSERQAHVTEMVRRQATTKTITLLENQHLKVFTNNFNIALPTCTNPTFETTGAGGRLRKKHRDAMGIGMKALFGAYWVVIGIYGLAGVDNDGTLLDFYQE